MNKKKIFLFLIVVAIIAFYLTKKNTPQKTYIVHPTQDKKITPVKKIKYLVKKIQTNGKESSPKQQGSELSENYREDMRLFYIKKYLVGSFPNIEFEITTECPKGHKLNTFWSDKNGDLDSVCNKRIEKNKKSSSGYSGRDDIKLTESQEYANGILKRFRGGVDSAEPIEIIFESANQLKEINLMKRGVKIFSIIFSNNLVIDYIESADIGHTIKYKYTVNDRNYTIEQKKQRAEILKAGKQKIENIMSQLCEISQHKKTCDAYEELLRVKYPNISLK